MAEIKKTYWNKKYDIDYIKLKNLVIEYRGKDFSPTSTEKDLDTAIYLFCGAIIKLKHKYNPFGDSNDVLEIFSGDKGLAKLIFKALNEKGIINKKKVNN